MDFYRLEYKGKLRGIRISLGNSCYDISMKAVEENNIKEKINKKFKGTVELIRYGKDLLSRREIAGLDRVDDISENAEYISFLFRNSEILDRVRNLKREYHYVFPGEEKAGIHICGRYIEQRVSRYLMKLILIDKVDIDIYGKEIYVSSGYLKIGGSADVKSE